ncbi:hypothetical protein [Yoonia sp.]|uniref:hypothetical protein n=1 Tax=Yoonia sp. TaxID=2212373 RepID=UPI002E06C3A3|nr:hypothetical protein [Yoonia sp.]
MTTISYTYTILAVHNRTMDVGYSNPDHGKMLVGVRRPKVGETVDQVVAEYSPAAWWAEQAATFEDVPVGATGQGATVFPTTEPEPEPTPEEALAIWRENAVISQLQAHYTLKVWGLHDQVAALVAAVGDPLALAFERATEWRRNSTAILTMFENITLADGSTPTPEDVDRFFAEAAEFSL